MSDETQTTAAANTPEGVVSAFEALVDAHKVEVAARLREVVAAADSHPEYYSRIGLIGTIAQVRTVCESFANQIDPPKE